MNPGIKTGEFESKALFRQAELCEEDGSFRQAFRYLLKGAQLNHVMSQVNVGNYYSSGKGVTRDLNKAAYWYKRAYQNGDSDGALNLAIDQRNQGRLRSAVLWFKRAAAMKNGDAFIELAKLYGSSRKNKPVAMNLLLAALRLDSSHISDEARESAERLVKSLRSER